eukprot:m.68828 g.68828  ORF g.68828 m.68828 type:complete len:447 (+) comp11620_c0_seq2:221-1561(+)
MTSPSVSPVPRRSPLEESTNSLSSSLRSLSWLSRVNVNMNGLNLHDDCSSPLNSVAEVDDEDYDDVFSGFTGTGSSLCNSGNRNNNVGGCAATYCREKKIVNNTKKERGKGKGANRGVIHQQQQQKENESSRTATPDDVLSYDWAHDSVKKPPFAYATIIYMALTETDEDKLSLSEIYQYVLDNFAYYRTARCGWKNSIRHNLSQEPYFRRVDRGTHDHGKGGYWALSSDDIDLDELLSRRRRKFKRSRSTARYTPEVERVAAVEKGTQLAKLSKTKNKKKLPSASRRTKTTSDHPNNDSKTVNGGTRRDVRVAMADRASSNHSSTFSNNDNCCITDLGCEREYLSDPYGIENDDEDDDSCGIEKTDKLSLSAAERLFLGMSTASTSSSSTSSRPSSARKHVDISSSSTININDTCTSDCSNQHVQACDDNVSSLFGDTIMCQEEY